LQQLSRCSAHSGPRPEWRRWRG